MEESLQNRRNSSLLWQARGKQLHLTLLRNVVRAGIQQEAQAWLRHIFVLLLKNGTIRCYKELSA